DGSGRTGTFICINELLDVIRKDVIGSSVPLAQYALKVATSRPQMIESVEQYAFIYTVISEWVRSGGETSVPLESLPLVMQQLRRPPKSGYGIGHCSSKYEAELTGYRAKNQYIVTQWPLMWTLCDFWCLVVDFQVSAIALLNPYKLGDQKYPVFWPTVKTAHPSMRFGPIGLELREVYAETDEEPGAFLLSVKKSGMAAFNPIEYKQCYNCVIRMASLLDDQIKANECERSKDPIEIFDELDRKRAVGELRPELIDTADQSFKQTPNPASRTQLFSPKKLPPPSTPAYPTPTTSPKLVANDLPKHSMPTIYRNQTPRRLPAVTERILPTTARRRLPTLNSIIENPLTSPPSNRTKKVLPPIVNSYTRDEFAQPVSDQFKTQIRCNGSRGTGNDLVALRKPLVRTETETTYLTSLFG
ncbi:unnamed protein product, partial [Mesocestoides corti]